MAELDDHTPGPDPLDAVRARFAPGWPATVDCGPGWHQLVADCDRELAELCDRYELYQVKEKFGGLRYYFSLPVDVVDDDRDGLQARMLAVSRRYELQSFRVCEETGAPGVLMRNDNGWYRTLDPTRDWDGFTPVDR